MRYFPRGVALLATGAMAIAVGSCSAAESLGERLGFDDQISGNTLGDSSGPESLEVKVAQVQGMNESDLKLMLRSLYSTAKDVHQRQIYPQGCLDAMQDVLSRLGSVDDEQRDVTQYMSRYAFLLARLLDRYTDFFKAKILLGDPKISPEDYRREVAKLPELAAKWTSASELLVGYLNIGAKDLKDKWDQSATTEKRLRNVLGFFEHLVEVYEAQQRLFRSGYALTQLRYMQHADRQADLTLLMEDPRQKQALLEYEDALENIKELTHQARKAAASSVQAGILYEEYLTLLPFPRDRRREEDDLPRDEM